MPQVIYTGQGREAPKTQGYAMQALSQYGQQSQARKTYELEADRKDRDAFAKMIELDPVYVSNKKSQDEVAKIMDTFLSDMALINKDIKGTPTMTDLTNMQQKRALAMTKMNYIKGNNDRYVQAAADREGPNKFKYDDVKWDEVTKEWFENGTLPEGPLNMPAVKDPFEFGMSGLMKSGARYENRPIKTGAAQGGEQMVTDEYWWNLGGKTNEQAIAGTMANPEAQWHIQNSFDRSLSDAEKSKYLNNAGGSHFVAANDWYEEGMNQRLSAKEYKTRSTRALRGPFDYQAREQQKTYYDPTNPDIYVYDGEPSFQRYDDYATAISGDGPGMAILNQKMLNIPADDLKFNAKIEFEPGSRIWVVPQQAVFKGDKMEYAVDPTKNGEVWVIADKEEDVPFEKTLSSVTTPDGKTKYKGRLRALTASGDVSTVKPLMGQNFGSVYDDWKREWSKGQPKKEYGKGTVLKNPTTTSTSTGSILEQGAYKGTQKSTNKYGV